MKDESNRLFSLNLKGSQFYLWTLLTIHWISLNICSTFQRAIQKFSIVCSQKNRIWKLCSKDDISFWFLSCNIVTIRLRKRNIKKLHFAEINFHCLHNSNRFYVQWIIEKRNNLNDLGSFSGCFGNGDPWKLSSFNLFSKTWKYFLKFIWTWKFGKQFMNENPKCCSHLRRICKKTSQGIFCSIKDFSLW